MFKHKNKKINTLKSFLEDDNPVTTEQFIVTTL